MGRGRRGRGWGRGDTIHRGVEKPEAPPSLDGTVCFTDTNAATALCVHVRVCVYDVMGGIQRASGSVYVHNVNGRNMYECVFRVGETALTEKQNITVYSVCSRPHARYGCKPNRANAYVPDFQSYAVGRQRIIIFWEGVANFSFLSSQLEAVLLTYVFCHNAALIVSIICDFRVCLCVNVCVCVCVSA